MCRLGLLSDEEIDKKGTSIDTVSNYLNKKLAYGKSYFFQFMFNQLMSSHHLCR